MLEGNQLNSILISRLRYLGDVVMATPLLDILRHGDPEIRLGFLAEEGHGLVLQGHPHLNELHLLTTRRRGRDASSRSSRYASDGVSAKPPLEMISCLRSCQYDLAVDLFFNPRSSWLLRLSGIPRRISGTRGSRRLLFSHNVVPSLSPDRYQNIFAVAPGGLGEHIARLAPLVHGESGLGFIEWFRQQYQGQNLGPSLPRDFWSTRDTATIPALQNSMENEPVLLAPGATWPVKQWPVESWKLLIEGLLAWTDRPLLVLQPPGKDNPWGQLGELIPASRGGVLPVLDLSRVLSLISRASLLVSVDGGVMHTGVGLGIPTIGLFGPTDPNLWFPYTNAGPFRVLTSNATCAPCNLHHCEEFVCLPDLMPETVLENCLELLRESRVL